MKVSETETGHRDGAPQDSRPVPQPAKTGIKRASASQAGSGGAQELPNLDLMRSFAVLLVVLSHGLLYTRAGQKIGYSFWLVGLLGVFLFFTHTTLVLMWSLERDPHPLRFYVRRLFRIYPLWLVVLFLSIAVRLPTSPVYAPAFGFFHAGAKEIFQNATLTFNLGFGCRLIGAAWSLPIEVQMYVVLPFLFFFMRSYRKLWPLLLLDALAVMTSRRLEGPVSESLLFCTPLFLPGTMAYIGFRKWRSRLPPWTWGVWLVVLSVCFNTWASRSQSSFRSGWLFALMVGLSLPWFRQISWAPLVRATHWIARYSYGIYLCHFAAIAIGVHYLEGHGLAVRIFAFCATIVALPVVFYHTVEKPMIQLGSRCARSLEHGPEPRMNERNLSLEPAP